MRLGFVIPNYPNEKRVALLPEHVREGSDLEIVLEQGFGKHLNISDAEYIRKGCLIKSRADIFAACDNIFSLKLIQPSDYEYLRPGQVIVGWTHPGGSGRQFMLDQAIPKGLKVVDLDNIYPKIYYKEKQKEIPYLQRNFIWKNSYMAGMSSTLHAVQAYGLIPSDKHKVAILSAGSVSQGAFNAISKFSFDVRLFYRKTMSEFKEAIGQYDIIINGIEVDDPAAHIITKEELLRTKEGCLIIDAAADAGNAIEGTRFTTIDKPLYEENGRFFYVVNNAPSIFFRNSSAIISESFSENVYRASQLENFISLFDDL